MTKNSDDYLVFGVGTLLGVLGGVVAGVIFSPKPGVEMRNDLKKLAGKVTKEVPSDVDEAKEKFGENVNKVKCKVEEQINKINEAVKAGRMASAKRQEELESGY